MGLMTGSLEPGTLAGRVTVVSECKSWCLKRIAFSMEIFQPHLRSGSAESPPPGSAPARSEPVNYSLRPRPRADVTPNPPAQDVCP